MSIFCIPKKITVDVNFSDDGRIISGKYDKYFKSAASALSSIINIDWRLIAAHAFQESSFNPNAVNGDALGLYQFQKKAWTEFAPNDYKNDFSSRTNVEVSTEAYINYMKKVLNNSANSATKNDQILIAIQKFHDGAYSNHLLKRYSDYNGRTVEAKEYIPKIMEYYVKYGGKSLI